MDDELAKLESLRQSGVLDEQAYWDARSRLLGAAPVGPPVVGQPLGTPHDPAYTTQQAAFAPWPQDSYGPPPVPPAKVGRPRRRWALIAAGVVVVLAGAGVGAYFAFWRDTSVTVSAKYVVEDDATARADCVGQGENASIRAGATARLVDGNGKEIGRGTLLRGAESSGQCTFRVVIVSVSDEARSYSLRVAGLPNQTRTHDELAADGWAFTARKKAPSGPLTGSLRLSDYSTALNDCQGTDGYDDIRQGAEVVVRDQDSRILGSGALEAGTLGGDTECQFDFTVDDVRRDQDHYTVEVSSRGEVGASRTELVASNWAFQLTLGS